MTKKLEEEFNLPPIDEAIKSETPVIEETKNEITKAGPQHETEARARGIEEVVNTRKDR